MSSLLLGDRVIVVQPALVRALDSIGDAAVLQQLHYWIPRAESEYDGQRWVYKTYEEWADEIGLSARQIRYSMQRLEEQGLVISCQPEGNARRKWYRINYQHALLDGETEVTKSALGTETDPMRQNCRLQAPDLSIASAEIGASTSITEITSETTTEIYVPTDHERLANLLADLIADNRFKRPRVSTEWILAIERMEKIDGVSVADIEGAIRWSAQDDFWYKNIRSPKKLREHFERLKADARDKARAKAPAAASAIDEYLREIQ